MSPPLIPCPQQYTSSWVWSNPLWQNIHHSINRKWEIIPSNSWKAPRYNKGSVACLKMCLLAWNLLKYQMHSWIMCYMPKSSPTGTMTATSDNSGPRVPMATPWHWLLPFNRSEYFIVTDYYYKMPTVHSITAFQCTIFIMNKVFAEHGVWESLHTENDPQFTNSLFAEFATKLKLHPRIPEVLAKQKCHNYC